MDQRTAELLLQTEINNAYQRGRADENKELVHERQKEILKQYTRIADALEKFSNEGIIDAIFAIRSNTDTLVERGNS